MKVVFMGTPLFAVPSLRALIEDDTIEVVAVVTQPDRPKGRGRRTTASPVKELAQEHGLPVLQPESIKGERDEGQRFLKEMEALCPDFIVVVAYGKILPGVLLEVPRLGCVNVHASLLPAFRGAAPANWAIIKGAEETGVTTMLMDEGMDTGPILLQERIPIAPDENTDELLARLAVIGAAVLRKTLLLLVEGTLKPVPQDEERATYAPRLSKQDGRIDWTKGAREVARLVRGMYPWPGAFTRFKEDLIKVHKGRAVSVGGDVDVAPGTIIGLSSDCIRVGCGSDAYEITELQTPGKRAMSTNEFLKGYILESRDVFL